jgi:DNA-binding response OmpR family regulator
MTIHSLSRALPGSYPRELTAPSPEPANRWPCHAKKSTVLAELLRGEGGVVSAEQVLEKAWDEHMDPFTGVIRFTMMMVRRKLGDPPVVETVPGAGYRIP